MTSLAHYHQLRNFERKQYAESPADQRLGGESVARLRASLDAVGRYNRSQHAEFVDVDRVEQDVAIETLCRIYREENDDARSFVRWSIDHFQAWSLITYGKRTDPNGIARAGDRESRQR
jgi:hypothetical protein